MQKQELKTIFALFISRLRHIHEIEKIIAQGKGTSEIVRHICKWNKID